MKSFFKITARIFGSIAAVIVVAGLIAYLTGFLYLGFKQPSESVANRVAVCDGSTITQYNQRMSEPVKDETDRIAKAKSVQQYVDQVKSKEHYKEDPTCVYMALSAAIFSRNQDEAKQQLSTLKSLADKSLYPSLDIIDVMGVSSVQSRVDALTTSPNGESDPEGRG